MNVKAAPITFVFLKLIEKYYVFDTGEGNLFHVFGRIDFVANRTDPKLRAKKPYEKSIALSAWFFYGMSTKITISAVIMTKIQQKTICNLQFV